MGSYRKGKVYPIAMLALAAVVLPAGGRAQSGGSKLLTVDYRRLVSRADLDYDQPATRSEAGMPIGNGRMGSLVWTTPSALRFQINRVDVFAANSGTTSFPRADSDYASGCAYLDINLVGSGEDVFTGAAFRQRLSLYDGLMMAQGNGVTARVLAWPERDVMAVEIDDQRARPETVNIDLRMLRYATEVITGKNWELASRHAVTVRTGEHSATSRLDISGGRATLTQQFREGGFYDSSAVAVAVLGRPSRARYLNESTVQLSAAPGRGKFTVLISSAASFDPQQDTAARALGELDAASSKGFAGLQAGAEAWWHEFWTKGFVHMLSPDGQADFVGQNYTYFLYLMGASSRGKYPPRFGGMLWYTNGDMRRWGSQFWWANTNAYYSNLLPAGRLELMDPLFSLYSGMYESAARAARQQWGSRGIWIPETVFFDGPDDLPEDIAAEMRELYLGRKPGEQRSARFRWYAETKNRHNSRWNFQADGKWDHGHYVVADKGKGVLGHTTHILGPAARIAAIYWQRYLLTQDKTWLRDSAYPMIKGAAEFYRNFPNLRLGGDGKYHIQYVNNSESNWGTADTPYELSSMHLIFPLAVRASEILGADADLRPHWQDIADRLPAVEERPRGGGPGGFGAFVYGGEGEIKPLGSEPELKSRFLNFNRLASFIDNAGIGGAKVFRNRLRLREGPGAIDAEHIGGLASGIHSSLLADVSGRPGREPVLQVFPAWPKDWDTAFTLLAPGAFLVTSAIRKGEVEFVELSSQAGAPCRLRNPWGGAPVTLYRNGNRAQDLSGSLLEIPTAKDETIILVQRGKSPEQFKRRL